MISQITILVKIQLRSILRDRVLYAVFGVAFAMLLAVPSLSSFSMRQVQELAITLSLSAVSSVLLVVTLLLGASSVWRDVERRYTSSILTLPISRASYIFSKFFSVFLFLVLCTLVLGLCSGLVISLAASTYPSDVPVHWANIVLVFAGGLFKYMILLAFALLLSTVSTSFYLPFFGTLIVFLCGNASQDVFEYLSGPFGQQISPVLAKAVTLVYYLIPNLSSFDFQIHAVYGLPVSTGGLILTICYALIYTGILLGIAAFAFDRRELP